MLSLLLLSLFTTCISPESKPRKLGTILDKQGHVVYHVIAEFKTVQAAKQIHGHSSIRFLNSHRTQVARYEVALPSELPVKLVKNVLYFPYTSKTGEEKTYSQPLGSELPEMLCVAPDNCYTKE